MAESAPSSGNCNPEREGKIALNLTMELKQTAGNGEEGRETGTAKMVFVVFVMHVLSAAWGTSPAGAYAVCKKAGVIDNYLVPHYDVLHSLGSNAIIEDVTGYIRERGVSV